MMGMWMGVFGVALAAPNPGIVGGEIALDSQWPEVVSLVDRNGGIDSFCSGTLIAPDVVLTAAHCVDDIDGVDLAIATGVRVQETPTDVVSATEVRIHPAWVGVVGLGRDAALVFLEREPIDPFLASLNSTPVNDSWLGAGVDIVGYGVTTDEGEDGGVLRSAPTVISELEGDGVAYFDGLHQVCFGDSGGPTFLERGGGRVQIGIHSYVQNGCVEGVAWDDRVDSLIPWIEGEGVVVNTAPAGPPDFSCSHGFGGDREALGVVPFELKCAASTPDPDSVLDIRWRFGDGAISNGYAASHTYTEQGMYHVTMCADLAGEDGPWSWCVSGSQLVTACDVPRPDFSVEPNGEPLELQAENRSDVSTYGCLTEAEWQVFEGSDRTGEPIQTVSAWAPVFRFDEPGTYTVVLHLGGYAGTGAAVSTVEVVAPPRFGCNTGGTAPGWFAIAPLVWLVRRRRQ